MVTHTRVIKWDQQAVLYFADAIRFIRRKSPQNAEKVKQEILNKIRDLILYPEIHPPDKFKNNNTGNYRAFELHRYRIAYLIKETEIIIARVRHTSQEPLMY